MRRSVVFPMPLSPMMQTFSPERYSAAEKTLPSRWGLAGVLGLGDPARSAGIYSVQGFLYPVTAGHVRIDADYERYRYDLQGAGEGRIRLFSFLYCGLRIILSRDVRRLIRRLRRYQASSIRTENGSISIASKRRYIRKISITTKNSTI